jgi:hypothetical protein
MDIEVGMGVTLPDGREGRVVRFSAVVDGEWEAEVMVPGDDHAPYVIQSISTMSREHVTEEQGMCTYCDLRAELLRLSW